MKQTLVIILHFLINNFFAQNVVQGTLSFNERHMLISELSNLKNIKIDSMKIIVVNFYITPKDKPNGSCIDHYTSDKSYKKSFKKKSNALQFFITEQNYFYDDANVVEDKNNILKDLIFKDARDCGNYLIIKPNGDFLKRLGEYRQNEIINLIKNF